MSKKQGKSKKNVFGLVSKIGSLIKKGGNNSDNIETSASTNENETRKKNFNIHISEDNLEVFGFGDEEEEEEEDEEENVKEKKEKKSPEQKDIDKEKDNSISQNIEDNKNKNIISDTNKDEIKSENSNPNKDEIKNENNPIINKDEIKGVDEKESPNIKENNDDNNNINNKKEQTKINKDENKSNIKEENKKEEENIINNIKEKDKKETNENKNNIINKENNEHNINRENILNNNSETCHLYLKKGNDFNSNEIYCIPVSRNKKKKSVFQKIGLFKKPKYDLVNYKIFFDESFIYLAKDIIIDKMNISKRRINNVLKIKNIINYSYTKDNNKYIVTIEIKNKNDIKKNKEFFIEEKYFASFNEEINKGLKLYGGLYIKKK